MTNSVEQLEVSAEAKSSERLREIVNSKWFQALVRVGIIIGALLLWELTAALRVIDPFWISRPSEIIPGTVEFLRSASGLEAVWSTFYGAMLGLLVGVILGVVSGFLLTRSAYWEKILNPFVAVLNSVPRLALTPLFILWFGIGSTSKVMMVFTLVYFIMLVNTVGAIHSVDKDLVIVTRLLGGTRAQITRLVVMPSAVPWLAAGIRVSAGNAFAGTVVAEMLAGNGGLGFLVTYASALLQLRDVFVAVILVMVLAYVVDLVLLKVEERLLRWRPTGLQLAN